MKHKTVFMNEKEKPCCKCSEFTKKQGHGFCKKENTWKARKKTCQLWTLKK